MMSLGISGSRARFFPGSTHRRRGDHADHCRPEQRRAHALKDPEADYRAAAPRHATEERRERKDGHADEENVPSPVAVCEPATRNHQNREGEDITVITHWTLARSSPYCASSAGSARSTEAKSSEMAKVPTMMAP